MTCQWQVAVIKYHANLRKECFVFRHKKAFFISRNFSFYANGFVIKSDKRRLGSLVMVSRDKF